MKDLLQENVLLRLELSILRGQTEQRLRDEDLRRDNDRLTRLIDAERQALIRQHVKSLRLH